MIAGLRLTSRARAIIFTAGATALILLTTQLILPGGKAGGGTPAAIVFSGVVYGLLNGLLATGIVLIYRSHHVVNFSQAALGAAGGIFTYDLAALARWPYLLAFLAGVIVATGVGAGVELAFVRRFFNAPRLVLTVITVAIVFVLQAAAGFVTALPIFGNIQDRTNEELSGGAPVNVPFSGFHFQVGSLPLRFGFAHLFAIAMCLVALLLLSAFFRYTRIGIAVRAAAENSERAAMLGINVGTLSLAVWSIAGALGGLSVILAGTVQRQFSFFAQSFDLLVVALAAAVIARMRSIPVAVASAVGITVLQEALRYSYERQTGLKEMGLFLVILIGLLLQRNSLQRSEDTETSSWKAVEEQRPTPKEMLEVGGIRAARIGIIVVAVVALIVYPLAATPRQTNLAGYYLIVAIVLLSIHVLTGWAGQVSFGQFAFVAVGAVVGGAMTSRWGIPFWIAIVLTPVFTAGFTMLVGLPALRIRGLFLGVVTLAYAYAVQAALFNKTYFGWLLPDRIDRPSLFLLDFDDERSEYYLTVAAVLLTVLVVSLLRRSRVGRVLIALRDNEPNAQAFGVNVVRTRLAAFGIAGFMCGFAGILLAHHQRAATDALFPAALSLNLFVYAIVGGVGSIFGVLLGAAYFASQQILTNPIILIVSGDLGRLLILYSVPGGLGALITGVRDGVYRIVAQRRQIVVPSLFADYDPEDLTRRLIPLAEPIASAGLDALPPDLRYRSDSHLYGDRGRLGAARSRAVAEDALALGAAAERFGADEEERLLADVITASDGADRSE